jgi:hypothetical protein
MHGTTNNFRERLDRPLTQQEQDLVRWLIEHSHLDASHLLPQIDRLRVAWRCNCGCPTIDFALDGEPVGSKSEQLVSDWLADVEGMPVGVMLWQANGGISTLEVYSLPGCEGFFGLPSIESIKAH